MNLSQKELAELQSAFSSLLNYESEDPEDPIDPLTYVAPDDDTCLHVAAMRGDYRSTELLLKGGVDVNAIGDMGCTALHWAKKKGFTDIVELLMANGASTTIINEFGRLP